MNPFHYGRYIFGGCQSDQKLFFLVETFALGPTASSILFKGNANDDKYGGSATNGNSNESISQKDGINWEHSFGVFTNPGPNKGAKHKLCLGLTFKMAINQHTGILVRYI